MLRQSVVKNGTFFSGSALEALPGRLHVRPTANLVVRDVVERDGLRAAAFANGEPLRMSAQVVGTGERDLGEQDALERDRAGGNRAGGDRAGGRDSEADRARRNGAGGNRARGDRARGNRTGGNRAGRDRAGGDRAARIEPAGAERCPGSKRRAARPESRCTARRRCRPGPKTGRLVSSEHADRLASDVDGEVLEHAGCRRRSRGSGTCTDPAPHPGYGTVQVVVHVRRSGDRPVRQRRIEAHPGRRRPLDALRGLQLPGRELTESTCEAAWLIRLTICFSASPVGAMSDGAAARVPRQLGWQRLPLAAAQSAGRVVGDEREVRVVVA